ncbi:MAG: glutathione S-transferase N-terminal domain-containing protein [Candidatus Manganitrophus sp.]|nr:glutathione S-transferase N-terminal domain-containing protein [Candidatus Manganitrophus sp.]
MGWNTRRSRFLLIGRTGKEVFEVSGQYLVPVLVDGDVVLDDEDEIIAYLEKKYGQQP